jgi:hypothetical protein
MSGRPKRFHSEGLNLSPNHDRKAVTGGGYRGRRLRNPPPLPTPPPGLGDSARARSSAISACSRASSSRAFRWAIVSEPWPGGSSSSSSSDWKTTIPVVLDVEPQVELSGDQLERGGERDPLQAQPNRRIHRLLRLGEARGIDVDGDTRREAFALGALPDLPEHLVQRRVLVEPEGHRLVQLDPGAGRGGADGDRQLSR